MTRARVSQLLFVATGLAATLCLAGCTPPGPVTSGTPTVSAPTSASASPVPSPTATPTPSDSAVPACTRDNLITTYSPTDNSAGHFHGVINFTNRLSTPCGMNGYPSVWFDNPEAQSEMGAQASFDTVEPAQLVVLQPGSVAQAALTITDAGMIDCDHTQSIALLVAPPLDHPADFDTDLQHVTIDQTPACFGHDAQLLTVGAVQVGPF